MKLSDEIKQLDKKSLPAPWEFCIGEGNDSICQTMPGDKIKPLLSLAQFSPKENEMKLLVLLRNNSKQIISALKAQGL